MIDNPTKELKMSEVNMNNLSKILTEAERAAQEAGERFYREELGSKDSYPCGFAWVMIRGVKGNTKLGRALKTAGVRLNSYERCFQIWNPSGLPVQNMDCKLAGAEAAAKVLRSYGIPAAADCRMD